jgi:hypothetical protein
MRSASASATTTPTIAPMIAAIGGGERCCGFDEEEVLLAGVGREEVEVVVWDPVDDGGVSSNLYYHEYLNSRKQERRTCTLHSRRERVRTLNHPLAS